MLTMIHTAVPTRSLYGLGDLGVYLGPVPKSAGGQFNCTPTKCYAIGKSVEEVFKSLQNNLNRMAGIVGFRPLIVDGFIGPKTLGATVATARYLGASGGVWGAVATAPTKENVTKYARELRDEIKKAADALNKPFVKAPAPTPTEKAGIKKTKDEIITKGDDSPAKKRTWYWWVLGGAAVIGIAAIAVSASREDDEALFPETV